LEACRRHKATLLIAKLDQFARAAARANPHAKRSPKRIDSDAFHHQNLQRNRLGRASVQGDHTWFAMRFTHGFGADSVRDLTRFTRRNHIDNAAEGQLRDAFL
jgi:hypothetical protein